MSARPMVLEDALHREGYTIDSEDAPAFDVTIPEGVIHVPAMVRSVLTWRRVEDPTLGDDLYLSRLPLFSEAYRPVLLSSILDRYRTRRIGYNTPGEFRLAVRRWGNLNMPVLNRRYVSTAVDLPLDELEVSRHDLDVESDFPQSLISGDTDYASRANDLRAVENGRRRTVASLVLEQREAFLNVDTEVVDGMDTLFLSIFDQGESRTPNVYAPPPHFYPFGRFTGSDGWGAGW